MSAVEIINDNCDVLKWHQRNDEIKQESARFVRLLQFRVWCREMREIGEGFTLF
jgi:hypothetical protein